MNFKDVTPEQRAEWQRKRAETLARKKEQGIPNVKTEGGATPRPQKAAKGKVPPATKDEIRAAIETVNGMLIMTGLGNYALSEEEATAEADALYAIAQDAPDVGRVIVRGKKFTIWGRFLWINYLILLRRRLVPDASGFASVLFRKPAPHQQPATGTARAPSGDERVGQDDAAGIHPEPEALLDLHRLEA